MAFSLSLRKVAGMFTGNRSHAPAIPQARVQKRRETGQVYLIGAGPGDPELLTVKAHRLIQTADVILIDWLVGEALYELFPIHAEILFVGKKCGRHSMKQAEINQLLVDKAQSGATVVRLKGGDPSVFGRLAEETDMLTAHNIPFAILPGITAASGVAAYSGIPLTHRECAQSVKIVTAHTKDGSIVADWDALAKETATLVFYMGLNRVQKIQQQLLAHGMAEDMPIAVIDQATTQAQQVVCKTLATFDEKTALQGFQGPALIIIGEVVNKRQQVELALLEPTYQLHN